MLHSRQPPKIFLAITSNFPALEDSVSTTLTREMIAWPAHDRFAPKPQANATTSSHFRRPTPLIFFTSDHRCHRTTMKSVKRKRKWKGAKPEVSPSWWSLFDLLSFEPFASLTTTVLSPRLLAP